MTLTVQQFSAHMSKNNQLNHSGVNKLEPIQLQLIDENSLQVQLRMSLMRNAECVVSLWGKPILTGDAHKEWKGLFLDSIVKVRVKVHPIFKPKGQ